jgi:hypothetical protein
MPRLLTLIMIWAPVSVALGVGCTQIPWGNSRGFHGTGFPFAVVYWDYIGSSTQPIDYPNPYAPILNSIACFVVGTIAISAAYWVASVLWRRRQHTRLDASQNS